MDAPAVEVVEGLVYVADLLSADQEEEVLGFLEGLDFRAVKMRGQTARRTVRLAVCPRMVTARKSRPSRKPSTSSSWSAGRKSST